MHYIHESAFDYNSLKGVRWAGDGSWISLGYETDAGREVIGVTLKRVEELPELYSFEVPEGDDEDIVLLELGFSADDIDNRTAMLKSYLTAASLELNHMDDLKSYTAKVEAIVEVYTSFTEVDHLEDTLLLHRANALEQELTMVTYYDGLSPVHLLKAFNHRDQIIALLAVVTKVPNQRLSQAINPSKNQKWLINCLRWAILNNLTTLEQLAAYLELVQEAEVLEYKMLETFKERKPSSEASS